MRIIITKFAKKDEKKIEAFLGNFILNFVKEVKKEVGKSIALKLIAKSQRISFDVFCHATADWELKRNEYVLNLVSAVIENNKSREYFRIEIKKELLKINPKIDVSAE